MAVVWEQQGLSWVLELGLEVELAPLLAPSVPCLLFHYQRQTQSQELQTEHSSQIYLLSQASPLLTMGSLKGVELCVSVPSAAAEELLCWEAPCQAASLLERLHLLQGGQRTHDLAVLGPVEHATETDPEALWWEGWRTVVASEPAG